MVDPDGPRRSRSDRLRDAVIWGTALGAASGAVLGAGIDGIAAAPLLMVVITSAGAYTAAPTTAPTPAPTPSIAAPSTAPDAAPRAIPQTAASRSWPERLRLRRSGSAMPGSIAAS